MTREFYCAFGNGNMGACIDGQQVPELQTKGWLECWLEWAESIGYNMEGKEIEMNGGAFIAVPFKTGEGKWNWEIKEARP